MPDIPHDVLQQMAAGANIAFVDALLKTRDRKFRDNPFGQETG
jgi:hypothetical protein